MDLEIQRPVYLGMSIEEIEMERVPSIRMATSIKAHHPTGVLDYTVNDLWFECSEWEKFIRNVRKLYSLEEAEEASLSSMSEEFNLLVRVSENKRVADFMVSLNERGLISVKIETSVALDEVGVIADSFSNAKFW
ncbi:hypothetical protein SAMN04488518_12517 [Pseudovibrio ascidiaceicola]|uniref:Uncharacterized protein n=1 Tax=Pseudovibrio ascidiaceicola TaxID=285279 RepID=A0A1I4G086_9HYPH|nr:hypothetical protein [Pseudovibrio ascidiaceicola]SFL23562.1 hypothetical protein SAMN04488518_12517 [Pseudovibrio ascidiaceicola]